MAEQKKKRSLVSSVKALGHELKTHWKKPAEGKYVSYREYKDIFIAVGSNYAGSKTLEYISFAAGCFLIMYHYKLPYLAFSIIGIINMPLGYIWSLIWWVVCDNLGFLPKKTERKLYTLYVVMMTVGILMLVYDVSLLFSKSSAFVTYLNGLEGISAKSTFKILGTSILYNGWMGGRNIFWRKKLLPKHGRYKYGLYADVIQKCVMVILIGWLPLFALSPETSPEWLIKFQSMEIFGKQPFLKCAEDVVTRVWVANLLFACYNVFGFANNLETCTQNISPNLQERILIRSYPVKFSHLFNSILGFILPMIIGFLAYDWADINVFRYVIPATFITFAVFTMIFAGRIQERIPQPPIEKKVRIKFWDGIFGVMRNKYRWINTIVGLIDALGNGMLAFTTVLYLYTFRLSGLSYGLIVGLISFAGTPPDLLTPYFLKRFSYKQIMIFYQLTRAVGNIVLVLALVLCGENLVLCGVLCCAMLFLMEATKTVPTSAGHDMNVRINDYQMYLSGERLESFSGIFGWFTGPITAFIGLIIPLMLLKYGFNSNWDVLFIDAVRAKIVVIPLLVDAVGFLLMTLPYFFWDYDSKKQNTVMEVLKRRAEVTNHQAVLEGESLDGEFLG